MTFERMYHGRLALADLEAGTGASVPIPRDLLEKGVGGGSLAAVLAERYPEAMFLSAGPLVGGYAPACGLMTVSVSRPGSGGPAHGILPLGHGAWLRQSGFDAVAVTGRAAHPVVIRCSGGRCVVERALPEENGASRAALRASLSRRTADGRSALLLAGGANADLPVTAGAEYGTVSAGSLVGPAMRARNILAVSLEGGSPLPPSSLPLNNPLRRACAVPSGRDALADFCREAGREPASVAGFGLRSAACFHCPSPCLAWIRTGDNTHLLLADHGGFAAAVAACGEDAPACLAACNEAGVDARIAGPLLSGQAAGDYAPVLRSASPNAGHGGPQAETLSAADRAGLILGVCPRLIRRTPGLTREALDEAVGGRTAALLAQAETLLGQEVYL